MTTKRTGYPVIDEILETIAPPPSSEQSDETYQCDACDRVITEDERRGGIRGGGEGTFCPECCGEATAPVPEPPGEWSYKVITSRYKIYDEHGEQVATADSEQAAVTIVTDHHAAQVQAGLVEALRDLLGIACDEGHADSYVPQVSAARTALKAVGGGE